MKKAPLLVKETEYDSKAILIFMNLKKRRDDMFACLLRWRSVRKVQGRKFHHISQMPVTKQNALFCSALMFSIF